MVNGQDNATLSPPVTGRVMLSNLQGPAEKMCGLQQCKVLGRRRRLKLNDSGDLTVGRHWRQNAWATSQWVAPEAKMQNLLVMIMIMYERIA